MNELEKLKRYNCETIFYCQVGSGEMREDPEGKYYAVEDVQALAATAGAGVTWQPIETAPKDGTWIIVGSEDGAEATGIAWWNPMYGYFEDMNYSYTCSTHWMPLPQPPTTDSGEGR